MDAKLILEKQYGHPVKPNKINSYTAYNWQVISIPSEFLGFRCYMFLMVSARGVTIQASDLVQSTCMRTSPDWLVPFHC